ncbi:Methyl-accepting chemotaxis protein [Methylobacterium phyllostachyos]|uniref:Methyl-accepting chemotaxis protein n=1 Tax=Methylobacterium phyllostachyos TaxID=582672 RepID=A0A1H0B3P9_9HYPH|nr:HAMP domain-containing methyl-accepting chemotaxis protein [Methylobacterium phyllostachyos]SDN40291.1 Methyl-accepting chemotaxis protein [Methylobacterium phyllostachyos]
MKILDNVKILAKIVAPLAITSLIGAITIFYALSTMHAIEAHGSYVANHLTSRLTGLQKAQIHLGHAALMNRNIIIGKPEADRITFKTHYDEAAKATLDDLDRLAAASESEADRAKVAAIRGFAAPVLELVARSNAAALAGDQDAAVRISVADAQTLREGFHAAMRAYSREVEQRIVDGQQAMQAEVEQATTILIVTSAVGLLIALCVAGGVAVLGITRPLDSLVAALQRMAGGAIDTTLKEAARRDEIGAVGRAVEGIKAMVARSAAEEAERRHADEANAAAERKRAMMDLADAFERAVAGIVGMVSSAAGTLEETARRMSATAQETAQQSTHVAAAAEQAATNVNTVAAATEELGSSIQEIGRQVTGSTDLAQKAVGEADQTAALVTALSETATRVGDVVGLISSIAGQTNLLALNATIEAARAGEAGRGFAVVAAEVKELANQTAKATEEIAGQMSQIQGATGEAVDAIGTITGRIREINTVAAAIAAAVEQQGAATREIVRNVGQATAGTQQVTGNIAGVAQASEQTGRAADQVLTAATDLTRHAEQLSGEVNRFLGQVRAA